MLTAALWAAVTALSPVAASAVEGQAPDSLGVRLVDAPVERRDDPRALRSIVDHVRPGDEIVRRVEVVSTLDRRVEVPIYVGGAQVGSEGFIPDARDAAPSELASWAQVMPSSLTLEPGERAMATVRLSIPADASDGERYGVIWADLLDEGGTVSVVNRVGVRIYLSVGDGEEPVSDFEVDSLTAARTEAGAAQVRVRVTNTGERALDLSGELLLTDGPAGLTSGPTPASGVTTLPPGGAGVMVVELDSEIPAGPWLARFTVRSGLLEKAAEATITFPDAPGTSADAVAATEVPLHQDRGFLLPLALGLLVLAFALVTAVWWVTRRRQPRDDDTSDDLDLVSDDDEVAAPR